MSTSNLKYSFKLANQRVLILGGSSGIGFAVAEAAFEQGAHLVLSSSNQTKLDSAAARIKETYPTQAEKQTIITVVGDLSDAHNLDKTFEHIFQTATSNGTHKLNHIVTTAGDGINFPSVDETSAQIVYNTMNVRFVAPAVMAKFIPKHVETSKSSSVTLTSGALARKPSPGRFLVGGLGAAVEGLARGMAVDLAPVRVNTVAPGAVKTEIFNFIPEEMREKVFQSMRDGSLTGTMGRPEDLAESYVYLMKDHFATAAVIDSNGGFPFK
ncbi:NAD(P)-binding protein [Penicillium angulare]|uniref:NAD(P)-binding protein n=1 Tax=Penicillium angulare TaxID=116970 RepID=UPI0025420CB0|nr:NAD(P)-binding protein [Penicillium angulare]KAJ5272642.1 NAD(P)-binding protein [Penicillium angulare]